MTDREPPTQKGQPRGRKKPPAGWYPHPSMIDTRRYWDGDAWTDNIAPNAPPSRNTPHTIKRIAWAVALIFLAPLVVLTFMGTTVQGESCGNWISPEFSDTEVAIRRAQALVDGQGMLEVARITAVADECNDAVATQRLIAFVFGGLGIGSRVAIPLMASALRAG
jgi:hypothetical protein